MYYPYFITYLVVGFTAALVVFFWALKTGQFKDQERARFLPLENEPKPHKKTISRFNRYEAYALLLLAFCGLLASGAVLVFSLFSGG